MTFMRKLLDILNMNNWEKNDITDELEYDFSDDIPLDNSSATLSEELRQKNTLVEENISPVRVTSYEKNNPQIQPAIKKTTHVSRFDGTTPLEQMYHSNRMVIPGLHLYFIDVAREIIADRKIHEIPLMREYQIGSEELTAIIKEMQNAGILNQEYKVVMTLSEFERFIDIYNPNLFECLHCIFDKDIFMCIGEIIYTDGVTATYDSLDPDEVIDYLNIMERLNIIKYDSSKNKYDILYSKEQFYNICRKIPETFSSRTYIDEKSLEYENIEYDHMDGVNFESFCAHILTANGYKNVKTTPASGDHGIDLLAEKDDISYAIQCKRYSSNIGNAAVQQAHTGKSLYHKDIAVVLTNRYFTQQAIDEAKELGVKLWDRDKLKEMLQNSKN